MGRVRGEVSASVGCLLGMGISQWCIGNGGGGRWVQQVHRVEGCPGGPRGVVVGVTEVPRQPQASRSPQAG